MKSLSMKYLQSVSFVTAMLFSNIGFSIDHVTLGIGNIKSNKNSIEFDLFMKNDGVKPLSMASFTYGINFNKKILNSGTITTNFKLNIGFCSGIFPKVYNFWYSGIYRNQIKIASKVLSPSNVIELLPNVLINVGHCIIVNSASWTSNVDPLLYLQKAYQLGLTSSQVMVYNDDNNELVVLTAMMDEVSTFTDSYSLLNMSNENQLESFNIQELKLPKYNNVSVYPSLVSAQVNLEYVSNQINSKLEYRIMDVAGRTVLSDEFICSGTCHKSFELPSSIGNGLLFIQILVDGHLATNQKLIVNRN